jgi:HJR/Mrr/RecB family endonuclease
MIRGLSMAVGLFFLAASFVWCLPLVPLWRSTHTPWPLPLVGHSLLGVGGFLFGMLLFCRPWWANRSEQRWFRRHSKLENLKTMPWDEFERLSKALLQRWGYVVEIRGGGHADGGIDLIAKKKGKRHLVQCKRYKGSVSVSVVREMYGVMHSEHFDGVIIMTSGAFTKDGRAFAKGKPMKLLSGEWLAQRMAEMR